MMHTINDSMFALILRFIGQFEQIDFCNNEFIQRQLKAIKKHINKFPEEEQEWRAIEWIEQYACEYRKIWEKEILDKKFSFQRCPDCPLSEVNNLKQCQIHDEWLEILKQYATDEIDSKEYIRKNLQLLAQHKENLKFKLSQL